jgi:hypothetical protein
MPMGMFGWLISVLIVLVPFWRILGRAGFPPALSLLLFIPLLGWLGIVGLLAFGDWPSLRPRTQADVSATFE